MKEKEKSMKSFMLMVTNSVHILHEIYCHRYSSCIAATFYCNILLALQINIGTHKEFNCNNFITYIERESALCISPKICVFSIVYKTHYSSRNRRRLYPTSLQAAGRYGNTCTHPHVHN